MREGNYTAAIKTLSLGLAEHGQFAFQLGWFACRLILMRSAMFLVFYPDVEPGGLSNSAAFRWRNAVLE